MSEHTTDALRRTVEKMRAQGHTDRLAQVALGIIDGVDELRAEREQLRALLAAAALAPQGEGARERIARELWQQDNERFAAEMLHKGRAWTPTPWPDALGIDRDECLARADRILRLLSLPLEESERPTGETEREPRCIGCGKSSGEMVWCRECESPAALPQEKPHPSYSQDSINPGSVVSTEPHPEGSEPC